MFLLLSVAGQLLNVLLLHFSLILMLCALSLKDDISDLPQFVKFSGRYFYVCLKKKVKNLISLVSSGHPYYRTISTRQDPT